MLAAAGGRRLAAAGAHVLWLARSVASFSDRGDFGPLGGPVTGRCRAGTGLVALSAMSCSMGSGRWPRTFGPGGAQLPEVLGASDLYVEVAAVVEWAISIE